MSEIVVERLGFSYPKSPNLINNLSLTVQSGEILGLKAPSGYGKSTLGQLIAGYLPPSAGTVTIDDVLVGQIKGYHPIQVIFQHPEATLNPQWKIRQSLHEGGLVPEPVQQSLGIEVDWLERWPNELSGGQLQRICIARALHPETKFIVADEITTMVDAITQVELWTALRQAVAERQLGVLVFSHNQALLDRVCTRQIDLAALNQR